MVPETTMISVIVPALNEQLIIEATLRRLSHLPGDFEVIVADNGSSDDTPQLASRWATVITSAPGRGPAMNAGAANARGEVLLFLHADTVLPEGTLTAIEGALADPGVVGGCFSVAFDGRDWRSWLVGRMYAIFSRAGLFYGDAAIFVRRDTFAALGGFKPLLMMEDFDFCLRLRKKGRTRCLPLVVIASARRWERQGFLQTMLIYLAIQGLYLLGFRRPWLFKLYKSIR